MQGKYEATLSSMIENEQTTIRVDFSAEIILIFELTGDFELGSEPIVFMTSIRNWYQI